MNVFSLDLQRRVKDIASAVDEVAMRRELEEVASIPQSHITRRERERLLVRKAVARLPQFPRLVVFMRFWEGADFDDIASTLGITVGAARNDYVAALSYLEKALRPFILTPDFFVMETERAN